ncbi:MAG: hypothetical protein U9Q23_02855 [Candidatus Bipolaricaulota bacterium]|nr:hypothetical protein [Candidatus Bipolaricaulota bacterium]
MASSFRPVTADHTVPGYTWNCGLCVMPGTRKEPRSLLRGSLLFLENLLGRRVELVTPEALSPYIGPHILREVERVSVAV